MKNCSLKQWLSWLETRQHQINTETKLEAVKRIAHELYLFPLAIPVITVTGTNGKGSCVAICESILRTQGYKIGSFYSPHLFNYTERIRINNRPASEQSICDAFSTIYVRCGHLQLTYFEFTTLAALLIFKQESVDGIILEAGIGGRLDTTNIIDADVSVITSIDFDHMHLLGNTREAIGLEKAGLFRSHRPAICGDANIPHTVFNYAQQINANLECYQRDFYFEQLINKWSWWNDHQRLEDLPVPNLLVQNAATAIATLQRFPLVSSSESIRRGLAQAYLPGRYQILTTPVRQIFDVAHNPAAARVLAKNLMQSPHEGKTYAVVGMLKDKDIPGTLQPLLPLVDQWFVGDLPTKRSASAAELAGAIIGKVNVFNTIKDAYTSALAASDPEDQIVVFGSFYTVGELCPDKNL